MNESVPQGTALENLPNDLSIEEIQKHPILQRVLKRMEERLASGEDITAHTAHNSHYSSLSRNDEPKS